MKDLVTRRYTYQFKNEIGYVGRSCHSAVDALEQLKERDDIALVIKTTFVYKTGRFCKVQKEEKIPVEQLVELEQTSYKLVAPGNKIGEEEILSFTLALQKARENKNTEGLLEITKKFDRQGNFEVLKTVYLLQGEVFPVSELLHKTSKLANTAVFVQSFSSKMENSNAICIMTPSGIIGFVGRRARVLDAGYALNK